MTNLDKILISSLCAGLLALTGCKGEAESHDDDDAGNSHAEGDQDKGSGEHADGDKDSDDHGADNADHGHAEVSIGTATVGDLQVECKQGHGETASGKEMHLVVKLPHNDAGATIVRAWIGTEDRLQSRVGMGTYAPSHDDYDVHVAAPDPLPDGAQWWIEVQMPDGTTSVGSIAFR